MDPGLLFHKADHLACATPDFLVWKADGRLVSGQVKCPYNPMNHLRTMRGGISDKYYTQVQWEAWVDGADEIHFVSYDPRAPLAQRLFVMEIAVNRELQQVFAKRLAKLRHYLETGTMPADVTWKGGGVP